MSSLRSAKDCATSSGWPTRAASRAQALTTQRIVSRAKMGWFPAAKSSDTSPALRRPARSSGSPRLFRSWFFAAIGKTTTQRQSADAGLQDVVIHGSSAPPLVGAAAGAARGDAGQNARCATRSRSPPTTMWAAAVDASVRHVPIIAPAFCRASQNRVALRPRRKTRRNATAIRSKASALSTRASQASQLRPRPRTRPCDVDAAAASTLTTTIHASGARTWCAARP